MAVLPRWGECLHPTDDEVNWKDGHGRGAAADVSTSEMGRDPPKHLSVANGCFGALRDRNRTFRFRPIPAGRAAAAKDLYHSAGHIQTDRRPICLRHRGERGDSTIRVIGGHEQGLPRRCAAGFENGGKAR